MHQNYRSLAPSVADAVLRENMDALNARLSAQKRWIDEAAKTFKTINELLADVPADEVTIMKRFNDERLAKLSPETVAQIAEDEATKVIRLVVDNDAKTVLDEVMRDVA